MPGPRAHRDGTLALLPNLPDPFRAFVHVELSEAVAPAANGLKYDVYRVTTGAWGFTVNDRWEGARFDARLDTLLGALGGAWCRPLRIPGAATTVSVAFDTPNSSPRIKVYQQEDGWGHGVIDAPTLRALGWDVPAAIEGRVGVVTTELFADGSEGRKIYVGGESSAIVAGDSPARAWVSRLATCTLPGWYYLTVRLRPGSEPKYALNKVYNVVDLAFCGRNLLPAVCEEVTTLTGLALPQIPGVITVPTAVAVDSEGADAYYAGWMHPETP